MIVVFVIVDIVLIVMYNKVYKRIIIGVALISLPLPSTHQWVFVVYLRQPKESCVIDEVCIRHMGRS